MKLKTFIVEVMIKPLPELLAKTALMYWGTVLATGIVASIVTWVMRRRSSKIQ